MPQIQPKIHACLWFDREGEPAAEFYTAIFPESSIERVTRYPQDATMGESGSVLTVEFVLAGQPFLALNGGPAFSFSEAISFVITTEDQAETDYYWDALTADGGAESQCGWLRDRFGVSWQVTPRRLLELTTHPDAEVARRAFEAMLPMRKIDIAAVEAAVAAA